MELWELCLVGVGLAMDAFAVSVCRGLQMKILRLSHLLLISLTFGGFQALMPLIGYALGTQFSSYIEAIDHWIAFGLLLFIGGKMIYDTLTEKEDAPACPTCPACEASSSDLLHLKELFTMALATSIDALAVGISFAVLDVSIGKAVSVIGVITVLLTAFGVFLGHVCGARYKKKATFLGGTILIGIGIKILVEHLT